MKNPRINVTFDPETYKQIKLIAGKNNCSMSDIVRNYTIEALNGDLTKNNINFISAIIREQLKIVLQPSIERLAALSAKTCVQAGTAAYLNAEAIAKFVPLSLQMEVTESYEQARKKAVAYTKSKLGED